MEGSIFLHFLIHKPFATFYLTQPCVRSLQVPASLHVALTFPHLKSCSYHGLFAVQEVNKLNILASNFSTCSNLLVFTTSSYVLISFVSHFFLRSVWILWSITSNILFLMSSTSFPYCLSVKTTWRIPTLYELNLT